MPNFCNILLQTKSRLECAGMVNHSQRTRICCVATMGKVWVVFCVHCVQFTLCFWHYFVHALHGCLAELACLAMFASAMQACTDPHTTVFTRMKQPYTFPTICRNPCTTATFKAGSQQLLVVQMANTRTSTVDGDTKQLFRASGPHTTRDSHLYVAC